MEIEQHNLEIHENRRHWERKPVLRQIYRSFYEKIARHLLPAESGVSLELGSGMGNIKEVLPSCLTSDLFPNPWLDRVENAYALQWGDASIQNLILFDVWHHLQHPGAALREFARVVRPGGRLVLFEPGMGLLARQVYRMFHHEPLGFGEPVAWEAPPGFDPHNHPYYAAQGNAWRLAVENEGQHELRQRGWRILAVERIPAWNWLLCGGLRGPQIYPDALLPLVNGLDAVLGVMPSLFASRLLVVLEREKQP